MSTERAPVPNSSDGRMWMRWLGGLCLLGAAFLYAEVLLELIWRKSLNEPWSIIGFVVLVPLGVALGAKSCVHPVKSHEKRRKLLTGWTHRPRDPMTSPASPSL